MGQRSLNDEIIAHLARELWAAFDYMSPIPPGELANFVVKQIEIAGYEIVKGQVMKIEIDLDKVRADVSLRKEAMESANSITVQVRQWGEMNEAPAAIPDEVLTEMMQGQIKNRIAEFIQYAPDVTDIKPQEVQIRTDMLRQSKQVIGSFYYCSQIVDHWKEQEARAVEAAKQSAKADAYYSLRDIFAEDCEYGAKECWQKDAMEYIDKMLGEVNE